jgi:mRNA interferase MazF
MNIKRGGIYLVNLDPTVGSEINKTRPVVVVSNEINNAYSNTITVLPITSNTTKIYPFEVYLSAGSGNLLHDSKVKADQIRTIDKRRFLRELGTIPPNIVDQINDAMLLHLGLTFL